MKPQHVIIGLFGCYCHPFDSWQECHKRHKQKLKAGSRVAIRCGGRSGTVQGRTGAWHVVLVDGDPQASQFHAANLLPVEERASVKKQSVKIERKFCQYCGAKRNIDQLEAVEERPGRYFQSGKDIMLYRCKKARRKSTGYMFLYCNGKSEPPEIWKHKKFRGF